MGTLTIPNTFTAKTYLDGAELDNNFANIKAFLNGGIDGTNLNASARLQLSQMAQPRSLTWWTFPYCTDGSPTEPERNELLTFPERGEIQGLRVGVVKTTAASQALVTVTLKDSFGRPEYTYTYNDNNPDNWGNVDFGPNGMNVIAGAAMWLTISALTNIRIVTVQLKVAVVHTER